MILGFTGTQRGMTPAQMQRVRQWVRIAQGAHHGDCIGADFEFHTMCIANAVPVTLHPPTDPKKRAYCTGALEVRPERPYLDRNKDIVRACDLLIAAPKETAEPAPGRQQGTWSTVRYARQRPSVRVWIVWPDGTTTHD